MRRFCEFVSIISFMASIAMYASKQYEAAIYLILLAVYWVKLWQIGSNTK